MREGSWVGVGEWEESEEKGGKEWLGGGRRRTRLSERNRKGKYNE